MNPGFQPVAEMYTLSLDQDLPLNFFFFYKNKIRGFRNQQAFVQIQDPLTSPILSGEP